MLEKISQFCLAGLKTLVLLMWNWVGLFLRKNYLLRSWGWLSLLNSIRALLLSLLLKLPQENWGLDSFCEFFFSWSCSVSLYFYHWPCMEYCCHILADAPNYYLEFLDKLQKLICRTVGSWLAASLEPLAHRRNVASWSLSLRITLVAVHLNWHNSF